MRIGFWRYLLILAVGVGNFTYSTEACTTDSFGKIHKRCEIGSRILSHIPSGAFYSCDGTHALTIYNFGSDMAYSLLLSSNPFIETGIIPRNLISEFISESGKVRPDRCKFEVKK